MQYVIDQESVPTFGVEVKQVRADRGLNGSQNGQTSLVYRRNLRRVRRENRAL